MRELLKGGNPEEHGFSGVRVWAGRKTLDRLENRDWLVKDHQPLLDGNILSRLYWQRFRLKSLADSRCDLLFVPGSLAFGIFRPVVTVSQNLLPFEPRERARYGISYTRLRLELLRCLQARTFRNSDGVIFLSEYAKNVVESSIGRSMQTAAVIPHGISETFCSTPRAARAADSISADDPFRILYVSIVDVYKHQDKVAAAVARLREEGLCLALEFVGAAYPPALRHLERVLNTLDARGEYIRYSGEADYADLPATYKKADLFVFASSCETFGMILTEAMASGLPVSCSERGPMPELLKDAGNYFDPEDVDSICRALREMVVNVDLRRRSAERAFAYAQGYGWKVCAERTFRYLAEVAKA